ncbi:MAG: hypothetical protein L7S45_01270, partial [Luminiphilus sp.]|nr:hypothetical protein [Luminiphilus sp.]
LYLVERDQPVMIRDVEVVVNGDQPVTLVDSDNDGVADADDAFPNDPLETADTDNDGVGDNADAFPSDASETTDTDNDGVGDNADVFPQDPTRSDSSQVAEGWSLVGTWMLSNEPGSLGVGPAQLDTQWWNDTFDDARTQRACFFDDEVIFGADGSFINVYGDETWIEEWQGADANRCGTPLTPYDASIPATFTYDETTYQLTINGVGSYLALPLAVNGRELSNVDEAPDSIVYNVYPQPDNKMVVTIQVGEGVWWNATYVKVETP